MGAAIKEAGNARFEKVKSWGHKAKSIDGTEAALIDPEVYFDFAFSCDQDPETILNAIRIEWRRQGGNRLDMKLLDCLDTQRVLVAYMMKPQYINPDWTTEGDVLFFVTLICT